MHEGQSQGERGQRGVRGHVLFVVRGGAEELLGRHRHGVERDAAGAGEALSQAVVGRVGGDARVGRVDEGDQPVTGLGAGGTDDQSVGDGDAGGERPAAVQDVAGAVRGEGEVGSGLRGGRFGVGRRVADVAGQQPLLLRHPAFEGVGLVGGAEEPGAPGEGVVTGEEFADRAVGGRDLTDDRTGGAPVAAAAERPRRGQQGRQTGLTQP
ncbi:hypothetical protein ACFCXR_18830 [Streptomyces noursei]|uniref:hypothetical protein n=1 Tax=Streptomyces noursei TaxID=1971 RepID=UPI0035DD10ED